MQSLWLEVVIKIIIPTSCFRCNPLKNKNNLGEIYAELPTCVFYLGGGATFVTARWGADANSFRTSGYIHPDLMA